MTTIQTVNNGDSGLDARNKINSNATNLNNDKLETSLKGAVNGLAELDGTGKLPASQLSISAMEYKGTWNASTNTPTLADGAGNLGDTYKVSVTGSQDLGSGSITFDAGDWVIYSGTVWEKSINNNLLTNSQVAFGSASNQQTSSSNFTWDDTNKRLAAGTTNTVSADNTVALGENNTASQTGAMAVNGENTASGFYSFAAGFNNNATGGNSSAFGVGTTASGSNSYALGDKGEASGDNSIAGGFDTIASGENSLALGNVSQSKGTNSTSLGQGSISNFNQLVIGRFNVEEGSPITHSDTDPAFILGNGTSDALRLTVAKLLKNGNFETIGTIKGRIEIVQVTALTKSLALSDANTEQEMSNAAAQTLTIEPDSTTNFPIGTRIDVINFGAGIVTLAEGAGVTIVRVNTLTMNGQGSAVQLVKRSANTWSAVGGLV
jgi:hypothetical protein